jgi:hypothetical protein
MWCFIYTYIYMHTHHIYLYSYVGFLQISDCFWLDWSLNSGLCTCTEDAVLLESHLQSTLLWLFGNRDIGTICSAWTQNMILPVSDSQEGRIIGMSHWGPDIWCFLYMLLNSTYWETICNVCGIWKTLLTFWKMLY